MGGSFRIDEGLVVERVVSPNGTKVALVIEREGGKPSFPRYDIWMSDTNGTKLERLVDSGDYDGVDVDGHVYPPSHSGPKWSPCGRLICFDAFREERGVYVLDLESRRQVNVSGSEGYSYAPSWSPDGSHILYGHKVDGKASCLCVARPDGSGTREIAARATSGVWNPDSKSIIFTNDKNRSLYYVSIDGTSLELIAQGYREALWSPCGKYLLCHDSTDKSKQTKVLVLNSKYVELGRCELDGKMLTPTWSPDSTCVAFGSRIPGIYWTKLCFIDIPSGDLRETGLEGNYIGPLHWDLTAGLQFEILHFPHKGRAASVSVREVISVDSKGERHGPGINSPVVSSSIESVAWSPDSKKLCCDVCSWVDEEPIDSAIVLIDKEAGSHLPLTDRTIGICKGPSWAPDGESVAFAMGEYRSAIVAMNVSSLLLEQITDGSENDTEPLWSPDGKRVAFIRDDSEMYASVYIASIDGEELERLSPPSMDCSWHSWSADSASLIFEGTADESEYAYYSIDIRSKSLTEVSLPEHGIATFRPDGFVSLVSQTDEQVLVHIITTAGEIKSTHCLEASARCVSWAPNCDELAYVCDSTEGELLKIMDVANGETRTVFRAN